MTTSHVAPLQDLQRRLDAGVANFSQLQCTFVNRLAIFLCAYEILERILHSARDPPHFIPRKESRRVDHLFPRRVYARARRKCGDVPFHQDGRVLAARVRLVSDGAIHRLPFFLKVFGRLEYVDDIDALAVYALRSGVGDEEDAGAHRAVEPVDVQRPVGFGHASVYAEDALHKARARFPERQKRVDSRVAARRVHELSQVLTLAGGELADHSHHLWRLRGIFRKGRVGDGTQHGRERVLV